MYQTIVWYTILFFVFLIALAFSLVYGDSKRLKDYAPIKESGYKVCKFYFLSLVAILGITTAISNGYHCKYSRNFCRCNRNT